MVKLYIKAGYKVIRQSGSHIQLAKGNKRQTIPNHKELDKDTEAMLFKYLKKNS